MLLEPKSYKINIFSAIVVTVIGLTIYSPCQATDNDPIESRRLTPQPHKPNEKFDWMEREAATYKYINSNKTSEYSFQIKFEPIIKMIKDTPEFFHLSEENDVGSKLYFNGPNTKIFVTTTPLFDSYNNEKAARSRKHLFGHQAKLLPFIYDCVSNNSPAFFDLLKLNDDDRDCLEYVFTYPNLFFKEPIIGENFTRSGRAGSIVKSLKTTAPSSVELSCCLNSVGVLPAELDPVLGGWFIAVQAKP